MAEREQVIAKPTWHGATREELLARGYVLSLDELNLPPSPELDEIISILQADRGPVFVALWFQAANSWLRGARPVDVVRERPQDVLVAARAEVEPISHG
ncbi:hypothetical protein [Aeromonas sp. MdU4]|uniref:hypothetical protein n=1 Tax=Aeromonas sp. MdU4 TaxID=3342819 RepID=UPI0035BB5DE0